ncbi:MAG: glycosyltransferase [Acidobacteriota bacterium]
MTAVDVVVVEHGHRATLAAVLQGLVDQRHPPHGVVAVHNAPTAASLALSHGFVGRLPLTVVISPENRGFSAAFNDGLRRSTAPWVLSLNPDCRLESDFLAELVAAAERVPAVGAASGLLLRARGDALEPTEVVDSAGMIVTSGGRHLDRGSGRRVAPEHGRPALVFGVSGAAALYRREALDDVAYPDGEVFDERFFAYREDADLAWRLQRRGWSCLYWPRARAWHARGLKPEAARRGSLEINRLSVRNRFLLRLANADWRWHLACFPAWLIRDLAVVAACLTIERASLPGLAEAWRWRHQQRARGRWNRERSKVSGWRVARWFLPGGRLREVASP